MAGGVHLTLRRSFAAPPKPILLLRPAASGHSVIGEKARPEQRDWFLATALIIHVLALSAWAHHAAKQMELNRVTAKRISS